MKQWKKDLVDAIIADFDGPGSVYCPALGRDSDRVVKFSDVAKSLGHKKILAEDIREIAWFVHKERPELHAVRFIQGEKPNCTESLWNTLFITDLEWDEEV